MQGYGSRTILNHIGNEVMMKGKGKAIAKSTHPHQTASLVLKGIFLGRPGKIVAGSGIVQEQRAWKQVMKNLRELARHNRPIHIRDLKLTERQRQIIKRRLAAVVKKAEKIKAQHGEGFFGDVWHGIKHAAEKVKEGFEYVGKKLIKGQKILKEKQIRWW